MSDSNILYTSITQGVRHIMQYDTSAFHQCFNNKDTTMSLEALFTESKYKIKKYKIDLTRYERLYDEVDSGHDMDHINRVRASALMLGRKYLPKQLDLLYIAASLHDIGLSESREGHEEIGADMVRRDKYLAKVLSPKEVKIVADSISSHRYTTGQPLSTFDKIIYDSDKCSATAMYSVYRAIMYRIKHGDADTMEDIMSDAFRHQISKYGDIVKQDKLHFKEAKDIIKNNVKLFTKWGKMDPMDVWYTLDAKYRKAISENFKKPDSVKDTYCEVNTSGPVYDVQKLIKIAPQNTIDISVSKLENSLNEKVLLDSHNQLVTPMSVIKTKKPENLFNNIDTADTSYPLILSPKEDVVDGIYRLAKAYTDGIDTLKARKFKTMKDMKPAIVLGLINKFDKR